VPAPTEILDLVARFEMHVEAYKAGQYNETQLRRDYLDPLFKALGWDIDNTAGHAEAYREDEIRLVEGADTSTAEAASPAPEPKPAVPPGRSTPQSEADAAHYYSFKEEPPNPD
jgi:hypothetical protein